MCGLKFGTRLFELFIKRLLIFLAKIFHILGLRFWYETELEQQPGKYKPTHGRVLHLNPGLLDRVPVGLGELTVGIQSGGWIVAGDVVIHQFHEDEKSGWGSKGGVEVACFVGD